MRFTSKTANGSSRAVVAHDHVEEHVEIRAHTGPSNSKKLMWPSLGDHKLSV